MQDTVQMLQQAFERLKIPSSSVSASTPPRVTTPELTPSLAALEDATTLKEKHGKEVSQM